VCLGGKLKVSISDPKEYDKEDTFSVGTGDVVFWSRGCKVRTEAIGPEPTTVFYLEVPSAERLTHHMALHPK
jgi:hypothetical protein